jgi:ribosylpyrimidine nucleosidase
MGHFCRTQKEVFGWEGGPLHDPVTVASLLDPGMVMLKGMNVQIDLSHGPSYGRTNCDAFDYLGLPHTAEVAVDIDAARFWDVIEQGLRRF